MTAHAKAKNLRINGQRLWDSLMEMAKIGATEKGGVCRLALTDIDKDGRDLFIQWCEEAGLHHPDGQNGQYLCPKGRAE